MTPTVKSHHGAQDGIRWGDVTFKPGDNCRFVHDMISGQVRLFRAPQTGAYGGNGMHTEDTAPERIAAVREALSRW